jgi:peptide/nickel transport system permease protein
MTRHLVHRLGQTLIVLAVMSFLFYALIGLMPGDPIDLMVQADPNLTPADAQRLKALYGLDRPIHLRYWAWLQAALGGDLGYSRIHTRPVMEVLLPRLGNTLVLLGASLAAAVVIAVPLGIYAALRQHRAADHLINLLCFAGISIPPFWLALMLIILFAVILGWLPASGIGTVGDGGLADRLRHLVLPVATLTVASVGGYIRFLRAAVIETMRLDFIRTARAKGASQRQVVLGHALRNALIRLQPGADRAVVRDLDDAGWEPARRPRRVLARPADRLPMSAAAAPPLGDRPRSITALVWRRFLAHRFALASEDMLGLDATAVDLFSRFAAPSAGHPLGTDELGRDLLLRLLYGGRVSLFVGLLAALIAALIGTLVGLVAGYHGGRLDALLMRLTDGVIALPLLPLLIVLAAVDLSKLGLPADLVQSENVSLYRIILIIALVGWTTVARLVRNVALSLKEREFVLAATALGAGHLRIMTVHILPNLVSPIIVATTLSVGNVILFESVLSFLGLGIQPPIASWGNMLTGAQELIWEAPALAFYPGILIFVTVIAFNFLGDGLQDALDPKAILGRAKG